MSSMTGDQRCFRVTLSTAAVVAEEAGDDHHRGTRDSEKARHSLSHIQSQRTEHNARNAAATGINPDPAVEDAGEELWMKRLGLSRYIAGLRKDEVAESYKLSSVEANSTLQMLHDISNQVLSQVWRECQHGPQQRLTDPQAVRVCSFWHADVRLERLARQSVSSDSS